MGAQRCLSNVQTADDINDFQTNGDQSDYKAANRSTNPVLLSDLFHSSDQSVHLAIQLGIHLAIHLGIDLASHLAVHLAVHLAAHSNNPVKSVCENSN